MHQRTVIRHGVKGKLLGQTAAEARVFRARVLPLRRHAKLELPCIGIFSPDEEVDDESRDTAPRELTRELEVVIEGWVTGATEEEVEDAADALADQIETAMHADPYLAEQAMDSILAGTTTDLVEDGDRLLGVCALTYLVTYRTLAPAAPEGLDDFLRVEATHNLDSAVHADERAEDLFTVQETP